MVTMKSAENVLKSVYLDVITNQLNTEVNPFFTKIQQSTDDVWGKEVRKLVSVGINGGIGAGTEDGDLPSASGNQYVQFVSTLKNLYGQIELTDKAIRASESNAGAFVNLLNAEMEGLLKASKFNLGRMLYGNGTGSMGRLSSQSNDYEYVVSKSLANKLMEGMVVDLVDGSYCEIRKARIVSINRDKPSITVDKGMEFGPSGGHVYVQGSSGNEITGLGAIFDNTSLYGVDKSTNGWMKPYVKDVNGTISESAIQKAIDRLSEVNGSEVDFIVCSAGVKRAYQELLSTYRRNIDIMDLKGGFKALSYNGIPLVSDRFVDEGVMYLLNSKEFRMHQLCDWKWLENENGNILRQNQGKPTYSATLVKYAELMCYKPCGQARLSKITEA